MLTLFVRNGLVLLSLAGLSVAYLLFAADHVPDEYALMVNFVFFPVVVGCLSFFALRGTFYSKALLVMVIPLGQILFFGGDPAKPGLGNVLALFEFGFLVVGLVVALLGKRVLEASDQ
jgi:hypothetical protein